MHTLRFTTPPGPLTVIIDDDACVHAGGFTDDVVNLSARLGLHQPPPTRPPPPTLAKAVAAWLQGEVTALDRIPVTQKGTRFQQKIWDALRKIPAGTTASYGDLAHTVGRPNATRAVGSACGRNLLAPFVPCHRAVRRDGSLGGYAYGLAVKQWLLEHETG